LENAIYSVSSPEAAASILYKDATQSLKAAEAMKITAEHMVSFGVADGIISEPKGGSHRNKLEQTSYIKEAIRTHLGQLQQMSKEELINDRYQKFRKIGKFAFI